MRLPFRVTTGMKNAMVSFGLVGICTFVFRHSLRSTRSTDIFTQEEHLADVLVELKREEFLREEQKLANVRLPSSK